MSDKLTLSAAISVLMMTAYALFGEQSARVSLGPTTLRSPEQVAIRALPPLDTVLAGAGSRHILY